MDINPFELLKNAQKIQEQMGGFQEKLGNIVVTGSAGGGMAEIDLNGRMEVQAVRLSAEAVDPSDLGLLQDLIKAAFTDASEKAKEAIRGEMGSMAGGLGFPNGLPGF
ncbi:YbaB/EbfC family nucleoid-associated protein [Treponema sp.]